MIEIELGKVGDFKVTYDDELKHFNIYPIVVKQFSITFTHHDIICFVIDSDIWTNFIDMTEKIIYVLKDDKTYEYDKSDLIKVFNLFNIDVEIYENN